MNFQQRKIEVIPYSTDWPIKFQKEADVLRHIFGDEVLLIEHIGSTAIPDMPAKPIIDILIAVKSIGQVDDYNVQLAAMGYMAKGEFGIKQRRFFIKPTEVHRDFHLHVFENGNPEIHRHILFKRYLLTHPVRAKDYAKLKLNLAKQYPNDIEQYIGGKNEWIKQLDQEAAEWEKKMTNNCHSREGGNLFSFPSALYDSKATLLQ